MVIGKHLDRFAGMPVVEYDSSSGLKTSATRAWRVAAEGSYGEVGRSFADAFAEFISQPEVHRVKAMVIGLWDGGWEGASSETAVESLVIARDRLKSLKSLFFGDITYEEFEVSWIVQSDMSPLLNAYRDLEEFHVRGTGSLRFGRLKHDSLRTLVIQSGGLPSRLLHEITGAELAKLEHLELWLGTPSYGGDVTVDDLSPILSGKRFPNLRTLGLCNRQHTHELLPALLDAPILKKVETLDLSRGTLNDVEAQPFLDHADSFCRLRQLDLSECYLSEAFLRKLKKAGVKVRGDGQRTAYISRYDDEEYRYCVVGE